MVFSTFQEALSYVEVSSYFIIFILMIIEGPIVTSAAAFAASLGYLNILIVFILSLLGDLIGDLLHYGIGRFGRLAVIERYDYRFGLKKQTIKKLETNLKKHLGKTLFAVKFIPILTNIGLILAGALRIPLNRFLFYSFLITLPRTIFFTGLGFYFGRAVSTVLNYFKLGEYSILFVIIVSLIAYFIYKFVSNRMASQAKNNG